MSDRTMMAERGAGRGIHRAAGLCGALVFAAVGLAFLFFPGGVIAFFNTLSPVAGLTPLPETGFGFYLILAVGYMYLAALLAFMMYRHPENRYLPLLLAHGKLASSALSFFLLAAHGVYLMYVMNGVVDGLIGAAALSFYFRMKRGYR